MTEIDPALDIAKYINAAFDDLKMISDGVGNNLYVQDMPDAPDFAVSVIRYEGGPGTETFSNPLLIRNPRVQVMVRNFSSNFALNRAGEILRLLVQVKDKVINGHTYGRIGKVGEPFELGPDAKNRERAVVNFAVEYYDSV